jgi:restriction system protein
MIDAEKLTLKQWLKLIVSAPVNSTLIADYQFPTNEHREEYFKHIDKRSEEEVIFLLRRFLLVSTSLGIDEFLFETLEWTKENDPERYQIMAKREFYKRLIKSKRSKKAPPPWEGNTWIIDLLPHFPKLAIDVINAYLIAHCNSLPDGRLNGLIDASDLIYAKFIGIAEHATDKINILHSLTPRQFECIVECLYEKLGYTTMLTAAKSDGGRDVIASNHSTGRKEELHIECKRYRKPVGVELARQLLGVISSAKATKGVIVTTSTFTKGARDFSLENPRVELIHGRQLIVMMNEHLGSHWPAHVERLILESMKRNAQCT